MSQGSKQVYDVPVGARPLLACGAGAKFSELCDNPSLDGPNRPDGIYVIRFRNAEHGLRSKKFLRVYDYHERGGAGFNLAGQDFSEA